MRTATTPNRPTRPRCGECGGGLFDWTCAVCEPASGYVIDCDTCALYGDQPWPLPNALDLAAVHDDLHHHGEPTATVHRV